MTPQINSHPSTSNPACVCAALQTQPLCLFSETCMAQTPATSSPSRRARHHAYVRRPPCRGRPLLIISDRIDRPYKTRRAGLAQRPLQKKRRRRRREQQHCLRSSHGAVDDHRDLGDGGSRAPPPGGGDGRVVVRLRRRVRQVPAVLRGAAVGEAPRRPPRQVARRLRPHRRLLPGGTPRRSSRRPDRSHSACI